MLFTSEQVQLAVEKVLESVKCVLSAVDYVLESVERVLSAVDYMLESVERVLSALTYVLSAVDYVLLDKDKVLMILAQVLESVVHILLHKDKVLMILVQVLLGKDKWLVALAQVLWSAVQKALAITSQRQGVALDTPNERIEKSLSLITTIVEIKIPCSFIDTRNRSKHIFLHTKKPAQNSRLQDQKHLILMFQNTQKFQNFSNAHLTLYLVAKVALLIH